MNYFSQGNLFVITSSSSMHRNSLVRVPKKKKREKTPVDGYEVDLENTEKILPPPTKKPRKLKKIM